MGHTLAVDAMGSDTAKMLMNTLPINIAVLGAPLATAEMLADYTKQAFISFQQEIQRDFSFRRFRVKSVSAPKAYSEAKDYFVVNIGIEVVYDEGWVLRRDDLKLKSIGLAIFDSLQQST